jgi:EmrB/QacA subfamily drug resistance transporter
LYRKIYSIDLYTFLTTVAIQTTKPLRDRPQMSKPKYNKNKIALTILCSAIFIIAVSDTVLNLALPAISGNLGTTATQLLWIVDSYVLMVAALQIVFGLVGDRYGRKRMLQTGLLIFGIGSLAAAVSTSANLLIIFRIVTGLGAAIMMPSTLSIITDIFREPNERTKAIAAWASMFSIGAGVGPIIGGALLTQFEWSSIFYLNIPIVLVGLIGSHFFLPESCDKNSPKPNILNSILFTAALVTLVYAIINAGEYGWLNTDVLATFVIAATILSAYLWCERRTSNQLLPTYFFKIKSFSGAIIALTLSTFTLMGSLYFLSQYFQSIQGYSALETGLCLLPFSIFSLIFTMLSVRVDAKIGTKLTVTFGLVTLGCGLLFFAITAGISTSYLITLVAFLLQAVGLGLIVSPATSAIMNSIPASRAGIGSAMNDTSRQIGAALGVAVLGSIVNSTYLGKINASTIISALPPQISEQIQKSLQSALIVVAQLPESTAQLIIGLSKQAFLNGIFTAVVLGALILFIAAIITAIILPNRTKRSSDP